MPASSLTPRARHRPAPGFVLGIALLAIGVLLPSAALSQSADEIRAEIERQQALLRRIQAIDRGEDPAPQETEAGSASGIVDSRSAPPAPEERDLPTAIFDEKKVHVPAGRWQNPEKLVLLQRTLDADGDGKPELLRYVDPESGFVVHQESDRNYDGTIDAWSDYEWGEIVRRSVDSDDDGRPDGWERYARGRMTLREVDRDGDGVRDGFYTYEGGALALERHDTDNDGRIDRVIHYRDRRRTSAEEDVDKDGRTDVWYRYAPHGESELVTHIERDKQGRGRPDVFETFEADERDPGRAVLARREEDVDGDGRIDIVSVYRGGKLVRRELTDPDLRPL